jgi:transcriptional regulator with XRE-family HTH domain
MENSRFPNKLKKYRRLFCLSQKEVAKMLGLKDTSPLSRWEKGVSLPNILHLFRLSRIYKTMPSEMYFDLWQGISKEISVKENNLLAQDVPVINNEPYKL